ncbi:MAG: SxtJ family membrane protein [Thiogranum sp.]
MKNGIITLLHSLLIHRFLTSPLLAPATLKPVYASWMKFDNVMNWISVRIIPGILFYAIFLLIGIIMRLFGKNPMQRKPDSALSSYRVNSENNDKSNVERPYWCLIC